MTLGPDGLRPEWRHAEGGRRVGGWMSTRAGGVSAPPWDSLNLGLAVGDDPASVRRNRALFKAAIAQAEPVFLKQVHGHRVLRLQAEHALPDALPEEADACVSTEPGLACVVQVADCLPVLFAAPAGLAVGAAHAGWRGLAAGVLENTLQAVCDAAGCAPDEVQVWMGACIGARQFEVGTEVMAAFPEGEAHFTPRPGRPGKWLADLPGLARQRLQRAGVAEPAGGHWCTVEQGSDFFSFRRDGVTGRMAAAIWIEG